MGNTSVYDDNGRMRCVIADSAGVSAGTRNNRTFYTYDGLHRLESVGLGGARARTYAYDDNGNVTSTVTFGVRTTYAYSRGSTPNQLDSLTVAGRTDTFLYDANGSAVSVAGNALSYDHRGLLTGYGAYDYTIDAEGFRVKKTGGSTVYYVRGAGGSVLATYDAGGDLTATYVYAGGERLASVAGGAVSYYLKDHLGSTRTLLSSSGTAAATYDYWPYGEVLATGGTDATPFKFTGHERDPESGLDFMPNRTYGPVARRFWQVDPMAHKLPSWSPYVYSFNNPVVFRDPTGAIAYPITIRSFAPWNYFGGVFHGDGENRGFTTSLSASARIHQKINFDTDKTTLESKVWSSPSSIWLIGLTRQGVPSLEIERARIAEFGDSKTFHFGTHAYGSVPQLLGLGPNIDLFSDFTITESDGLLSISGSLKGDNFPATEAFITDPSGQNVFIGVGVPEGNPFTMLRGENRKDIASFKFGITTDSDGNFTGVRYNGKDYSISEWNRQFEQKDPEQDDE